ncbi:MAG: MFS transporter [Parachlamydiales bacterium]
MPSRWPFAQLLNWHQPLCCRRFPAAALWWLAVTVTFAGTSVVISLMSIILLLSEVEGALAVSPTHGLWLGRIFLFTVGLSPLFAVRISWNYGFKRVLFCGILLFMSGAILTPFTSHYSIMFFCRLIGGLGGGVVISVGLAILSRLLSDRYRAIVISLSSSITFGLGIALGLLYSGYIGQIGTWQLMSLPDIILAPPVLLLLLLFCPELPTEKRPPYDYLSLFSLYTAAFALFLIVTQVKEPWNTLGWRSGFTISCWIVSLLALSLLVYATWTRKYPLLDHRLLKDPVFIISCLGMAIVGVMIFGVTLTSIGMLETIYRYEKWTVGWFLSSIGLIYCLGGILPSLLVHRVPPVAFALVGIALITLSCFIDHSYTVQSTMGQLFVVISMRAVGVSLTLGPITTFALSDLPHDIAPRGAAIVTFIRQMGGAFGSGIIQTIQITREAYHNARFGEMVNVYSPRYEQFYRTLDTHLSTASGPVRGGEQSTQLIIADILNQSKLASLLDAIWIFGWVFLGLLLTMIALLVYHRMRRPLWTQGPNPG